MIRNVRGKATVIRINWKRKTKKGLSYIREIQRKTKYIYVDAVHKCIFVDVYHGVGRMPSILVKQTEIDYS